MDTLSDKNLHSQFFLMANSCRRAGHQLLVPASLPSVMELLVSSFHQACVSGGFFFVLASGVACSEGLGKKIMSFLTSFIASLPCFIITFHLPSEKVLAYIRILF